MLTSVTQISLQARYEAQVRQALGDQAFTVAFEQGAALITDHAIAYALQHRAGAPPPAAALAATIVLTRRERQVAELLADGLTNKAIAGKLAIAERTAESHVRNILAKLGFTGRSQVAAWLGQQPTRV